VNEWQPFWKNLTGQIASISQRYLPEQKAREGWLSRFLPSSNSAKKDSSKSASQNSSQELELEPKEAVDLAHVEIEVEKVTKPRKPRKKKPLVDHAEQKATLRNELIAEIKPQLEREIKLQLETEFKPSIESALKETIEADLRPSIESELTEQLTSQLKAQIEAEYQSKYEAKIKQHYEDSLNTKLKVESVESQDAEQKVVLRNELIAEIKPQIEGELKSQLEADLKPKIVSDLKETIEADLRPDIESELTAQLTSQLKAQIEEKVKAQIEDAYKARYETEIKKKLEASLNNKLKAELTEKRNKAIELPPQLPIETTDFNNTDIEREFIDPTTLNMDTKRIVEAILFAADKPMTIKQIQKVYPEIEQPELPAIQAAIESIVNDYVSRPIGLAKLASGYRFQVKEAYAYWVSRLFEEKPPRYSRALLETMSIITYRQPVTRGDIEDIRGVGVSSSIIRTLLEREWIRIIAHKEVPGRPALYGTTKQFLDYFNLSSLEQLPTLEEVKELDFSSNNPLTSVTQPKVNYDFTEENLSEKQSSEEIKNIDPSSETRH